LVADIEAGKYSDVSASVLGGYAKRRMLASRLEAGETLSLDEYKLAKEIDWSEKGEELREQRIRHGITLAKMARETGFSASTLSRFENGHPVQRANVIERSYSLLFRSLSIRELADNTFKMFAHSLGNGVEIRFLKDDELADDAVAGIGVYIDDEAAG